MTPFLEIVEKKRGASIVYEDEHCMAIMDIHPIAPGHVIVFSKEHFETVFDIDSEILAKLSKVVKKISIAMKKTLECDGVNIFSNSGKAAQQTIFHFNFHVIPRWKGDNVRMLSRDSQFSEPAEAEELNAMAAKIKTNLT